MPFCEYGGAVCLCRQAEPGAEEDIHLLRHLEGFRDGSDEVWREDMEEASAQELRGIAEGLAECSGLVRSLLRKGLDDAEFLALAERLQALSEEVEHLTFKHNKS